MALGFCTPQFYSFTQDFKDSERDVPYVVTPIPVVNEMLRLAQPLPGDILIDLGSGDGRIVINAAKEFGIKAVGIEIDPELVNKSKMNALRAGVGRLVEFRRQDLFTVVLRPYSILTMYLLPEINQRLLPKIFREMRPGSRVISHDFDMGEWLPDETGTVFGEWLHLVNMWIVPANVSGLWRLTLNQPAEEANLQFSLQLTQRFQVIKGSLTRPEQPAKVIQNTSLKGNKIAFSISEFRSGQEVTMFFQGQIKGEIISGTLEVSGNRGLIHKTAWRARRSAGTMIKTIY